MLDGPRIPPANGGPAKSLVVLLHGYGADGNDLIDIGRFWAPQFPDTAFVSPNAPEPCPENPIGRQWFPLSVIDLHLIDQGVQSAAPVLNDFLDAELARHGLDDTRLALVGFSQGTMMALEVGPRRSPPPAGIVGYSGLLAGPERLETAPERPPVLLVHGEADPLIPVLAMHATVPALGAADFQVEWHVSPDLEHGIDAKGLELGGAFLQRVLR
ncbi:alpha/beta hydrolase [Bauldia sp.]|uniref:alpha/beta hydrolase n=1 Tax=Bauldia sp. TaxID=2575872 RepID=UPI003BA993B7